MQPPPSPSIQRFALGPGGWTVNPSSSELELPAASVARRWNVCAPTPTSWIVVGDVQVVYTAASSAQANDADGSFELHAHVTPVPGPSGGLSVNSIVGAVRSTVQPSLTVAVLSAASVALTRNSCAPSPSDVTSCGLAHAANATPSSEHSNIEGSSALQLQLADVPFVSSAGRDPNVTIGATASAT
jgi:hypothetical protein